MADLVVELAGRGWPWSTAAGEAQAAGRRVNDAGERFWRAAGRCRGSRGRQQARWRNSGEAEAAKTAWRRTGAGHDGCWGERGRGGNERLKKTNARQELQHAATWRRCSSRDLAARQGNGARTT